MVRNWMRDFYKKMAKAGLPGGWKPFTAFTSRKRGERALASTLKRRDARLGVGYGYDFALRENQSGKVQLMRRKK